MKPRNLVIIADEERLKVLESEYRMLGYYTKRTDESLTVFTRRPQKSKHKKRNSKNQSRDRKQTKSRNK